MEICSEDRLKLHHDALLHWPFIQRIDWSCFYCIEYITNSIKSKLRLDVEKPISAKYGSQYIIGLHIRKRWIITLTFNQVHLELLHNLYQWREKIHFRQFISLWKYALDIYPGTLWRDLLWPSLTFDQYHCTFLYTSNFGWSMSQMRQWVGEICFEQGFTEKCDLTFYFFIWIRLLHIHYPFKLYEGNLIQIGSGEHKIYSERDFDIGETNCNKSPTNQGNIIMRSVHGPQQPPKYNATV